MSIKNGIKYLVIKRYRLDIADNRRSEEGGGGRVPNRIATGERSMAIDLAFTFLISLACIVYPELPRNPGQGRHFDFGTAQKPWLAL